jgi:probable HAF family extracellular repeat protein
MMTSMLFREAVAAALAMCACSAMANRYTVVDLGAAKNAVVINRAGVVAGNSQFTHARGQVYRGGQWHNLTPHSIVLSMNRPGDVVGYDLQGISPMLWRHNEEPLTLELPDGATDGEAKGINDSDVVVGEFYDSMHTRLCFMWTAENGAVNFGLNEVGVCTATDINNNAQVTGDAQFQTGDHAFIWDQGTFKDLGTLPETSTSAGVAINDNGAVIGVSYGSAEQPLGFLWDGELNSLDPNDQYYDSMPMALNRFGDIVGFTRKTSSSDKVAVRFAHSRITPLASEVVDGTGWVFQSANSINDKGVIVGDGTFNGSIHAFMLVPQ